MAEDKTEPTTAISTPAESAPEGKVIGILNTSVEGVPARVETIKSPAGTVTEKVSFPNADPQEIKATQAGLANKITK